MTFFGSNLYVACKELPITVEQIGIYVWEKDTPVTLYNSDDINSLLNMSLEFFKFYRAWFTIPGRAMLKYEELQIGEVAIKGKKLKYPMYPGGLDLVSASDIFSFIRSKFVAKIRPYDMILTMAEINGYTLTAFVEQFANKW